MTTRETWTGIVAVHAGCWTCQPNGDLTWFARNAQGVAARHHDATGHTTWAESLISVHYGDDHERDSRITTPCTDQARRTP